MSKTRNVSPSFFQPSLAKTLLNNKSKKRRQYTEKKREKKREKIRKANAQAQNVFWQPHFDKAGAMWASYMSSSNAYKSNEQRYDKVSEIFNFLNKIKANNEDILSLKDTVSSELDKLQFHVGLDDLTTDIVACEEDLIKLVRQGGQSFEAKDALLLEIAELNESMVPIYERLNSYQKALTASLIAKGYLQKMSIFGDREKDFSDELDESIEKNQVRLGYQVLKAS